MKLLYIFLIIIKTIFCSTQYKVLVGETLSLECSQNSPTWFFRSLETNIEELIVTRHGIVNVEFKNKITSHPILRHKILFINKINFNDDGLYSCLYTKILQNSLTNEIVPVLQDRQIFNVSVYSKFLRGGYDKKLFIFFSKKRFD
jgi:hypothetical protein